MTDAIKSVILIAGGGMVTFVSLSDNSVFRFLASAIKAVMP